MIHNIKESSGLIRMDKKNTNKSVIFDNSFISMLTAREVARGHHNWQLWQDSRLLWGKYRQNYDLYVAEVTIEEINAGTIPQQVKKRLDLVVGIEVLPTNAEIDKLAKAIEKAKIVGKDSSNDAILIATGCYYGVDFLLTLNMNDMANERSIRILNELTREHGIHPIRILTPGQMLYNKDEL